MSRAVKIIITIGVCFVFLVTLTIGFGIYWWSRHSHELFEAGARQIEQGKTYGKQTDEQGCLDEAVSRYKAKRGMTGSIAAGLFLRSCLEESRPTPGFCDQVPKRTEIMKSVSWRLAQAKKAGLENDQYGQQLFAQVQEYCEAKRAGTPPQQ